MCSACWRSTAWLLVPMQSAGQLPNKVIALERCGSLDFADPRSHRFVITTQSLDWEAAVLDRFITGALRSRTPSEQQYSDRKLRSRRWCSFKRSNAEFVMIGRRSHMLKTGDHILHTT